MTRWEPVYSEERPVFDEGGEQIGMMRDLVGEVARERTWHPLTIAWWEDVWRSPMKGEFARVDVHRFYILADLVDRYWHGPSAQLATEIRLQEARFGLDSMSRRSLQWEIAKPKPRRRPTTQKKATPTPDAPIDPRSVLHAVLAPFDV
jgi:hypothetical protein